MCDVLHLKTIDCNQGAVRAVRYNGALFFYNKKCLIRR